MSTNAYAMFRSLLKEPRLSIGTVVLIENGEASISLPGGGVTRARGDATVGQKVFVRNRVIEGAAPNLPIVLIEV
jgi:hypothetical protein